jgi:hypothetical protein
MSNTGCRIYLKINEAKGINQMKILKWRRIWGLFALFFCFAPMFVRAQLTPPNWPTNISSWEFYDTNTWTSDLGYLPLSSTNIVSSNLGDNGSLAVDTNVPAWVQYNVFEKDGWTNLTVNQGTITLWFAPGAWASTNGGTGPGDWGRLIEVGEYTTNASYGWWSLFLDPGATNIYFAAQTNSGNGATSTFLSAPIAWNTNEWHFIALTYSATNSALYLDGKLKTNGLPATVYPGLDVLTNGLFIGSDSTGTLQAHGMLDDIFTYNYPLDAGTISNIFNWEIGFYITLPWNTVPNPNIQSAPSSPETIPTFNAVTGNGNLTALSTNTISCITSSNVWLTNIVATKSGTNMNVTFSIVGGSNGVPYDVFANSILSVSASTNTAWAWMGQGYQCVTYSLTNLPGTSCFLILGLPIDTDQDGLTDAYERLVSKTNPFNPDTDGDGMLDGWEVVWGYDPLNDDTGQTGKRSNYTYDLTGWLNTLTGTRVETVTLDAEGNVQTSQ